MTMRTTPLLAAALAAGALLLTGCAGPEPAAPPAPAVTFDEALHDRLPAEVRDAGVLTVATDASYAPASSFAPDGRTIVGFEPDLVAAMGTVLGVEIEMVVTDFDTALDVLGAHEVDAVMSAMTDTAERQEKADFINYFSAGSSIVVQRGNPHGVAQLRDLCGLPVAVEEATVQVSLLERGQAHCGNEPMQVSTYQTNDDALVELRTGRVAAVLNDYPPAVYLTTHERTQGDYQLASDVQYEPGLYGIAVAKDRARLRDSLQAALERVVSTGTYKDVLIDWGVAEGAVGTVSVNGGRRLGS